MRDSDLIVAVGVVVGEVGVAEGAEEGEEAGVVAIETAETTMTTIITMMIMNRVKESREAIPGIAMTLATGNSERRGVGTENVVIAMAKDGREGEGAGEEEGAGDMAAIATMIEKREGIAEGVMIEVVVTMKMVERDRRGAVKAETGMIGMGKKFYKLIQPLLSADGFSELL